MKKTKPLNASAFFTKISERANYLNEEVVREVFYEMIRVAVYELRTKKIVKLPDFGEFKVTLHKEHMTRDVTTGQMTRIPPYHIIKFSPDYKLKKFFHDFEGDDDKMANIPKSLPK
jgi:nucleoid DNA-binding protein